MKLRQALRDKLSIVLLTAMFLFVLPTVCAAQGKIAFSFRGVIYLVNPDGTNQTQLTNGGYPSISRDGSKIVFSGSAGIYVINADGSNLTQLTNTPGDRTPQFNPDGSKIAFYSERDGSDRLYLMNADGSNPTALVSLNRAIGYSSFSPDGSKIAFIDSPAIGSPSEIFVINDDGTNRTRLTYDEVAIYGSFSWGVNNKIAYSPSDDRPEGRFYRVCVINADGTNKTCLTDYGDNGLSPAFSPDASKIVYAELEEATGLTGIFVMNADGSNKTRLNSSYQNYENPTWGGQSAVAAPPPKLKIAGGNILIGSPGQGIILKSPNAATCKLLSIDNAGAMVLSAVSCP